jgi:hypothetical protein
MTVTDYSTAEATRCCALGQRAQLGEHPLRAAARSCQVGHRAGRARRPIGDGSVGSNRADSEGVSGGTAGSRPEA